MSFPYNFRDSMNLRDQYTTAFHPSFTSSTTAAYGVLLSVIAYYILQYFIHTSLPFSGLLWHSVVWIIPSRIVCTLDSGFEPAVAENRESSNTGFPSKSHASKSSAMRRILGLDGAGTLTTVQRAKTLSHLGSVFRAKPNRSLPGLGNWDNSCYQNSILQGLAALESLPAFLDRATHSDALQPTKSALRGVISRLNDPANMGKTFWTPAELKSMSSWQQQDAQEYFSKISDELEKDTAKGVNRRLDGVGLEGLPWSMLDATHATSLERLSSIGTSRGISEEESKISQLPEELISLIVRNPLEGLLAQRVGCQRCGYVEGLSLVPFNCLTVPLGKQWMYDIRACLDDYTALEPITGVECAKCTLLHTKQSLVKVIDSSSILDQNNKEAHASEAPSLLQVSLQERLKLVEQTLEDEDFSDNALKRCQIPAKNRVSATKTRQAVVARAPRSLVIHINRSKFDELTGVQSKNLANVRYPQQLNLAPWCLGRSPESDDTNDALESWSVNPSESMLSDGDFKDLGSDKRYVLRAVVTHYGRHENGHYICYRKSPYSTQTDENNVDEDTESWWRLSDEEVTEVDEDIVLSQGGVFMLFYEQLAFSSIPIGHRPAVSSEYAAGVAEDYAKANQDNESAVLEENLPVKNFPKELHSRSAESALPAPPPSPGKAETDKDLPRQVEVPQVMNSSDIMDTIRTQTPALSPALSPAPSPSHAKEPMKARICLGPTRPSASPQSTTISELKAPEADEIVVESSDATPPSTSPKESQPVSPVPMRTAGPRHARGSASRAGKAMGSVAGFVQAN